MTNTVAQQIQDMNARERAAMARLLCPVDADPVHQAMRGVIRAAAAAAERNPDEHWERDPGYRFAFAQMRWTQRMEARR